MKRRSVLMAFLSLILAASLLSAPAMADKGKEPQGKGKQPTEQSAAYEAGFALGQNVAKITAVCIAVAAVGGVVIGTVCRSRRSGEGRQGRTAPLRTDYYHPAGKGETCGRMPERWAGEESPAREGAGIPVFPEDASPWPRRPAEEAPPAPREEPAPVHPALGDNPFAAFDEFFGGHEAEEELLEMTEDEPMDEPEDDEPGEVNFKI